MKGIGLVIAMGLAAARASATGGNSNLGDGAVAETFLRRLCASPTSLASSPTVRNALEEIWRCSSGVWT